METIDSMSEKMTEISELKAYSNSQYQLIINQSKKIRTLEDEIIHLKQLVSNATGIIKDPNSPIEIYTDCSDEEAICRMELVKLKKLAIERELTLEEAKRTEIYTKLLISVQKKDTKGEDQITTDLADLELIAGGLDEQAPTK